MATHKGNKRLRRTAVNTTHDQSVSSAQNQGNIEGSTSHDQPEEHRVYDYIVQGF